MVDTPQGDSLSPDVFTIIWNILSKKSDPRCRDQHPHLKQKSQNEVAYADDVDFIGQNYADIKKIQEVLKNTNLKSTRKRQDTHQYQRAKKDGKK